MINVPKMPLYWRFKDSTDRRQDDPPALVPFGFDYQSEYDLFIESRSTELTNLLADIYSRDANVGFLQDGHSLINTYGSDFWLFFNKLLDESPARKVLEIGCGGCVLLERLKGQGLEVLGIDPSPFAAEAGERKGIKVIQEYFSPKHLNFVPDLIFQVDVLEHIEDPLPFLKSQANCMAEGGVVVVNVPDCSRSLERGDISLALHQHVNMFDMVSLPALFRAAGFEVIKLERSSYGAALYCAARKTNNLQTASYVQIPDRLERFEAKARRNIDCFQSVVEDARKHSRSVGFFMPQRAFPYLGMMDWFEGFRVFDNLNLWHRKYLDGINVPVENQADLVEHPVDHLFVMSLTFGNEVAKQLRDDVPRMKITTLDEILSLAELSDWE